jgi:WD40 repeat protein
MLLLKSATGQVNSLAFSPDGGSLAVVAEGKVTVWQIAAPSTPASIPEFADHVRFLHDDRTLILSAGRGLLLHDRDRNESTLVSPDSSWIRSFDLNPDGDELLGATSGGFFLVRLRDLTKPAWSLQTTLWGDGCWVFFLSRTRFVRMVLSWNHGGPRVVNSIHDAATGMLVSKVNSPVGYYAPPALSANRRLLAAHRGTRIAVFACDHLSSTVALIRNDNRKEFTGLAFHPSGRFLAATSNDATVKLYDTQTWALAHAFDWKIGRLRSVAFSPDGTLAAAGGDKGKVVVWDFDL